jgi:hypothetical protein
MTATLEYIVVEIPHVWSSSALVTLTEVGGSVLPFTGALFVQSQGRR